MRCNPSRRVELSFAFALDRSSLRWCAVCVAEAGLPTPIARVSLRQALTASAPVSGFTCTNTKTTPNAMDSWHNPEQTEVPRLISLLDLSERETVATSQQDRVESERRYEAQEQRSTPTGPHPVPLAPYIKLSFLPRLSPLRFGSTRLLATAHRHGRHWWAV